MLGDCRLNCIKYTSFACNCLLLFVSSSPNIYIAHQVNLPDSIQTQLGKHCKSDCRRSYGRHVIYYPILVIYIT